MIEPIWREGIPVPLNMNQINEEHDRRRNGIFGSYTLRVFLGLGVMAISTAMGFRTFNQINEEPRHADKSALYVSLGTSILGSVLGFAAAGLSTRKYIEEMVQLDREYSDVLGVNSVPPR